MIIVIIAGVICIGTALGAFLGPAPSGVMPAPALRPYRRGRRKR